jgi:hypothetical protein
MHRSTLAHRLARSLSLGLTLAVVLAAMTAAPTFAGKRSSGGGSPSPSSSMTLSMVKDANGSGTPNWSESITWTVSTTVTTEPHVEVTCSQNGALVYSAASGYYAGYPWPGSQTMVLSSQSWNGGAASCVGRLYYLYGTKTITITSQSFSVGA